MKQNSRKRSRGRRNMRSNIYDSNGPDVRIRGTANQVYDKYCSLAKDALGVGDKIMAENYLQHAEHYQRVMNANNEQLGKTKGKHNNSCKQIASKNQADGNRRVDQNKDDIVAAPEKAKAAETKAPAAETIQEDTQTVARA